MSNTPELPNTPTPVGQTTPRGYADAWLALKDVEESYIDWTKRLSETSFQLSLAIIGANWAAFGTVDKIMNNVWAKLSLIVVIVHLAINLIGTKWIGETLGQRLDYARADPQRWRKEYGESVEPWPFTAKSEKPARLLRELRMWFPLIAGALFLVALLISRKL